MNRLCANILFFGVITFLSFLGASVAEAQYEDRFMESHRKNVGRNNLITVMFGCSQSGPISDDLQLTKKQIKKMGKIAKEYWDRSKPIQNEYEKLSREKQGPATRGAVMTYSQWELQKKRDRLMGELMDDLLKKTGVIFLPFQLKRIQQISLQQQLLELGRSDEFEMIVSLSGRMKLGSSKSKELRVLADKLRLEYRKDLKKLRKKYFGKLTKTLPLDAKKKLKKLVGDVHFKEN